MAILLVSLFLLGYLAIAFESFISIGKATIASVIAILLWTTLGLGTQNSPSLFSHLAMAFMETFKIVLFLFGAMTIVALIDLQGGFIPIGKALTLLPKKYLVLAIGLFTFFLSAFLDNLTTTIVMATILNKMVRPQKTKWLLLGLVIIAANAGGAFSPIGDITTTMLWMGGQITPYQIMKQTFLASLMSMLLPALLIQWQLRGKIELNVLDEKIGKTEFNSTHKNSILFTGMAGFLLIPIFKWFFDLPAYLGMLLVLGLMALITLLLWNFVHPKKNEAFPFRQCLEKIDGGTLLFFFSILLAVAALDGAGILPAMAIQLNKAVGNNLNLVAMGIGLFSSLVDNIPLIAAIQHMYPLNNFPTDHYFWELLAYAAGTGGSCLLIGSAAGIAVMGMEQMDFLWYLKKISWIALIGFFSGLLIFILQNNHLLK